MFKNDLNPKTVPTEPAPVGAIPLVIADLESSISEIERRIYQLRERLDPVLNRQEQPEQEKTSILKYPRPKGAGI